MARSCSFWDTSIATPASQSVPGGLMGAARDTGDGCFCHQRYLPRMIVPGFADHDPGPGIEGMGTGALRGAGRTRRAVTGATPGRGPAFTMPPGAPFPRVRATGWHANDRTRVLPRLNGQPEPRAVLARAPRDLPCSPHEHAAPVNEGLFRNSAIGGADAAHPRNIRTAAEASAPPARLAPGRLRCLGHGRHPPAGGPARAAPVTWPGMRPAECRRGDRRQSRQTSPPPADATGRTSP